MVHGVSPSTGNARGPHVLIRDYERGLDDSTRRRDGVHYTPPALARLVAELAIDQSVALTGVLPRSVCDPTCGAGSILVAAADVLVARGLDPTSARERLHGADTDAAALQVARHALDEWAERHGVDVATAPLDERRLWCADTATADPAAWPTRPEHGYDVVVGNPPFLNQLSSRTARRAEEREAVRRRVGEVGAYADGASVFLLGAVDLVRDGGVVAMLQPQSFLAARDTAAVRGALLDRADLVSLWSSDELLFDASVRVCAPVLVRRASGARDLGSAVAVRWGGGVADTVPQLHSAGSPTGPATWGPLFASARGLPVGVPHGGARLGSIARATAGFRDEFYALCAAATEDADVVEWPGREGVVSVDGAAPRLVTVGMIDPGRCTWGERPRRLGGVSFDAPRLDTASLAADAPRVARWAEARLVPKVLVATQTRIVEAVVDPDGSMLPVTPTISVEPRPEAGVDVWHLCAALLAPPIAAQAAATHLGAGLSPGALRWSARHVLDVELPLDADAWSRGADLTRRLHITGPADAALRRELLHRLGRTMCAAHDRADDDALFEWWAALADRACT